MSNFDFLNNNNFLKHPSCTVLYEYARSAEAAYTDHEKCALKVRFVLEQFCIFVSEFKNAVYPEKIDMLGHYWCKKNWMEFIRIFGYENAGHIRHANAISRSFLHSIKIAREDIYPEMLESVYILLLWLYKELGFYTPLKYSDYNIKKISSDTLSFKDSSKDIFYSSEELKQNLKNIFPNCNTDQLCSVIKQADRYIVTDVSGNMTEEFIEAEKYEDLEKERLQLKKQLEQTGEQFEAAKKEFLEKQSRQEAYMAETYKKSLKELGDRYNALQEKYEELVPVKETKLRMQQQIQELIQERENQENIYSETQDRMLGEIAVAKSKLASAQQDILSMGESAKESRELIQHLENRLSEKEKELLEAQEQTKKQLKRLQEETRATIQKYKDKTNSLEIILTNVMAGNIRFREKATDFYYAEDVKNYLQAVNQGVSQIKEGYVLYCQNKDEQKLREYLWKVRTYYDSKIEDLEKALKEKDERLAQEQQKINSLYEALWEQKTGGEKIQPRKKQPYRWAAVLGTLFLVMIILVFVLNYQEFFFSKSLEGAQTDLVIRPNLAEFKAQARKILTNEEENKINKILNEKETLEEEENSLVLSDTLPESIDETEERLADEILKEAQKERERVLALPNTVAEISNVSAGLLDDMAVMREIFRDFYRVAGARYGDETEEYHSLGAYRMFSIVRTIYQIDYLKISKFVYCRESETGFRLAVEPEALSADISYHTSLAELETILGEADIRESDPGLKPTDFSEDIPGGRYIIATFELGSQKASQGSYASVPHQNIKVVYNEDMSEMLDYVYVFEHVGW